MSKITLDQLTTDDRAALLLQLQQQEDAKKQRIKDDRSTYKKMVNETIPALFHDLINVSAALSEVKTKVYGELSALVLMKADTFGKETEQYSHSFTTDCGITIIIGRRYNDGWDDTVTAGIEKVNKYLESMGRDHNSKILVKTIMKLLSKDVKGNMKASRVLQLKKIAEETANPEFMDAVSIIQDAYRPVKTKEFITVRYRGNDGTPVDLPLDITSAEFDFKIPSNDPTDQEKTEA